MKKLLAIIGACGICFTALMLIKRCKSRKSDKKD